MNRHIVVFSVFILLGGSTLAQRSSVPYAWLAGSWQGDGFGGTSEEVWSEPDKNGVMMGMFRHFKGDGSLNFYEFWVLDSTGLRLKHFQPNMEGWEEKEDFVHFKLIAFEKNKVLLKSLSYELINENEMEIRLDLKNGDKKWTETFLMTKK